MATRIEAKSRTNKRPQAAGEWSAGGSSFTVTTGRMPKVDPRGFRTYAGVDTVRVAVTEVA